MNAQRLIESLARFPAILGAAAEGLPADDVRWRPADRGWSILEIVSHLADEEVEVFGARLRATLRDPGEAWSPIDPEGWVFQRRYNEGDLKAALDRFVSQRRASVEWLRSLERPDWSAIHVHPKLGRMRAGDLLVAWTAHDALHLRQIAKRLYQMTQRDGGEYQASYAGSWRA